MASYVPPQKNSAGGYVFYVSLVSQADVKIFQANPTLATGDVKIAIDDGAPANLGTLPTVDADFTKRVKVTLSQAETNGDNLSIRFSDASGAEWCDLAVEIQTSIQTLDTIDTNVDSILLDTGTDGVIVATNNDKTGYGLANDAITSATYDETTAFPIKSADIGATQIARVGADGDTLETLSDQIDNCETLGVGATAVTYTQYAADGVTPLADVDIWATSDEAGTNIIASGITTDEGKWTFYTDIASGNKVYIWRKKAGWNFSNPDTEAVP